MIPSVAVATIDHTYFAETLNSISFEETQTQNYIKLINDALGTIYAVSSTYTWDVHFSVIQKFRALLSEYEEILQIDKEEYMQRFNTKKVSQQERMLTFCSFRFQHFGEKFWRIVDIKNLFKRS